MAAKTQPAKRHQAIKESQRVFWDNQDWIHDFTLGGKTKPFWWQMDEDYNIHIRRKFKNATSWKVEKIATADIDALQTYMAAKDWVKLANNVAKLAKGEEQEGIGKFLYTINKDGTLSSSLGALLTSTGIWEHNGAKRGIQFKIRPDIQWKQTLMDYYHDNAFEPSGF